MSTKISGNLRANRMYTSKKQTGHRSSGFVFAVLTLIAMTSCVQEGRVLHTDLTHQLGMYVVGYSHDPELRKDLEDQLVSDLSGYDIKAYASHEDIPTITATNPQELLSQAHARDVEVIVIVNELADHVVNSPNRIRADDPTVRTFFKSARAESNASEGATELIAEANGYVLDVDGKYARLGWSGATALFGITDRDEAIRDISTSVATGTQSRSIRNCTKNFSANQHYSAEFRALKLDRTQDLPPQLGDLVFDFVVDASGPFQAYGAHPFTQTR